MAPPDSSPHPVESPPSDPVPSPRAANPSKIAIVVGLGLFAVASGMIVTPRVVNQTTIIFPLFLACAALGVVMAAVGTEAKIAKPGSTIAGAGAIAIILFMILMKAMGDAAPRYRGSLVVRAADPRATLAMLDSGNRKNPIRASIFYKTDSTDGIVRNSNQMSVFDFVLDANSALHLNDENCPSLYIEFADGHKRIWRFAKSKMIPADYNNFFQLEFIVDKDKLYYDNGPSASEPKSCDTIAEKIDLEETDTQKVPPVGPVTPPIPAASSATPPPAEPKKPSPQPTTEAVAVPASPSPAPKPAPEAASGEIAQSKVAGYVIVLQLSSDFKDVKKSWFDIDGKPTARFPIPGDTLTASRDKVPVYPEPYHWDPATKKHVVPTSFMRLAVGQKVKIGGDPFIARDDNTLARYVISPIVEVVGASLPQDKPLFPPAARPAEINGYAYIGYLDADGSTYLSKTFDNYTNPSALYPSPGDILVATANVWMRAGPRRWDASRQVYVNADTVAPIKQGQYVQVGGDTFLAKGGLSVWAPIGKVFSGGLAEVAMQQH